MADDREHVGEEAPRSPDDHPAPEATPADDLEAPIPDAEAWSSWGNLWQVPAIALSVALIALGLHVASRRAPENDFDGVLAEVGRLIGSGEFDLARRQLQEVLEPNIQEATAAQQARYAAAVADWVAASQAMQGVSAPANNRIIADQYALAAEQGMLLSVVQIEQWANALIDLGEIEDARRHIDELEGIGVTDAAGRDARARRNRLLRRLVEVSLGREDLPYDAVMATLEDLGLDPLLDAADHAWVAAHQARLRLEAGYASEAVDRLLVDMRRLEHEREPLAAPAWAELYTLLGRAYYDQGHYDHATYHLEQALDRLDEQDAHRAEALLYLGHLDMAGGDPDRAGERFDEVVRGFAATPAHLPALLGRAEVRSILGDHAASLEDYRRVLAQRADTGPRRDVPRRAIAGSLADRHDAALTMGDLPLALEYVALAESLYSGADVPSAVLERTASTSRQIADNIMADAGHEPGDERPLPIELIDPAVRAAAAEKYERAAEYFVRHARSVAAVPDADEDWADSLWFAADSYDRAGARADAIRHLLEYIAGRPVDDPRRAEVTFRLGQAYQAEGSHEQAARAYEQVIDEHPRSTFGTGSHVPLARTQLALGRPGDAEQILLRVVEDRQPRVAPLTPGAGDYGDALVDLGKLYYDTGRTRLAIERLTTAVARYPEDDRIGEIRFRLADSHRRHALAQRDELAANPRLAPGDRREREQRITEHLETALELFAEVGRDYAARDERRLDRLQRDYERFAALYRGDCAYELGRYGEAAKLYDQAARRYDEHHASMHALVQIVNCYERLGDVRDADIAHHNALIRLRKLPDAAFDDPQALMDRAAWERWLENRPIGVARADDA